MWFLPQTCGEHAGLVKYFRSAFHYFVIVVSGTGLLMLTDDFQIRLAEEAGARQEAARFVIVIRLGVRGIR